MTPEQTKALKDLLSAIEDEGEACGWKRWTYFGPQGFAGRQLHLLLAEAGVAASPRPASSRRGHASLGPTPVIVRYAYPEVGDAFVQPPKEHHPGGYWTSGHQGGERSAMRFADEAEAKGFLARHRYDLPPLKVTFQPAPAG